MHLHTNANVTKLSICAFSQGTEYCRDCGEKTGALFMLWLLSERLASLPGKSTNFTVLTALIQGHYDLCSLTGNKK